ncbi:MAG TPA: histidine--tRNA ligase [Candidatus Tectomicrobia bacterium]|nr:histidine--tRNA ligase [Candidatus Tectomicrobia bacterium]
MIRAVRGVHDILPAESATWQHVEATARRIFEAYGYREIRLPLFERTELFARGIGEVTDIVQKEMYTFEDRAGESITLRPEATASLLRAYIEHGLHVQPKPVRLYTMGPMFRYERPQAGRYRQFHQLDVEALGEEHPALDAELMVMLLALFRALGLDDRLQLEVNSIGDAACRPAYREALAAWLRARAGDLCDECRERIDRNPLRVLDCKNPGCRAVLDRAPVITEALCAPCAEHFGRVRGYLDAARAPYVLNPRLVRGLDYYVRTTFELTTTHLGAQNAVAGGGRYDGLIELLGGPPEAGNGFAVGLERVVLLLGQSVPPARPRVVLIPLGDAALARLLPLADAARARGIGTDLAYGARRLRAELERAHKAGIPHAVIVGDDELARGEALVRAMATGEQRSVPLDKLMDELARLGDQP